MKANAKKVKIHLSTAVNSRISKELKAEHKQRMLYSVGRSTLSEFENEVARIWLN